LVADAPLSATGKSVSTVEGSAFTGVVATFTDANPNGAVGDYTATIQWGDGATSTGTLAYDAGNGLFTVTGTHAYAEEGSYALAVAVADDGGSTAAASSLAWVADAPLSATGENLVAIEGSAFSGVVATFSDGNPNGAAGDFTATINWGDGTT